MVVAFAPFWGALYVGLQLIVQFGRILGIDHVSDDFLRRLQPGAKGVPTYYSGMECDSPADYLATHAAMIIAMAFGAFHCVAWSFTFPSPTERLLWRVSSLIITCAPAVQLAATIAAQLLIFSKWRDLVFWLYYRFSILTIVPYITCRFMLLVLPFTALRSAPFDVYVKVAWPDYFVHVTR